MDAAGDVNDAEEGRWSTNEGRKTEEEGQQGKGMVNERGRRGGQDVIIYTNIFVQSVQEKLFFFTIHFNPSLGYIAVRDLQGSQQ